MLHLQCCPVQWKAAQVILIQKAGKPAHETFSYRPISLLPILSKVLETIIQRRFKPIIDAKNVIPDHQLGFRKKNRPPGFIKSLEMLWKKNGVLQASLILTKLLIKFGIQDFK